MGDPAERRLQITEITEITEMAVNKNLSENWENVDLDKLFSDANTGQIDKSFNEYLSSLDSFYTKYSPDTNPSLIRHYDKFNPDGLNEDDVKFLLNSLSIANYDENSLRDEHVIVFSEPVILSEINCNAVLNDEKTSAVRLITYKGADKKISTKRTTTRPSINKKGISTYKVHDVVLGLILPRRCENITVKIAIFRSIHSNYKQLERTQKALQTAQEVPVIEIQRITKKFQDINSIINIKRDKFHTMKGDIDVLEQEKRHAENSLENTKNSVTKVRSDLDKANREYEKLVGEIADEADRLATVKGQVSSEAVLHKKEGFRLNSIKDETKTVSETLHSIKEELADANREKNLTTLDMAGHSNETSKQLKPYYIFAFLAFSGLVWMAKYVYLNGEIFTSILPFLVNVSAWDILISRLPLITATTLIIGGLSGTFFYLIKHIISLNTEKMTMLKAAILAEQITDSLDSKGLTEQEELEFKRNTKIKLIMQVFSNNEPKLDNSNLIIEALKAVNSK
jgi:hypothetical protein